MDMPDKIGLEFRFTDDGDIHRVTFGDTSYTRTDLSQSLADALEWYLQNDDTNMGDPNNGFYIEGNNRARTALANYRGAAPQAQEE